SAYGDVPSAVAAIKAGAQEFLTFPDDLDGLIPRARRLVASSQGPARDEIERRLVGRSAGMRRVRERIAALASLSVPVLVQGEPGTGRDRVVRVLHELGARADVPLVSLRCGAAGTGDNAVGRRPPTRGASVYLDEVGRLELREQARWLDVLHSTPSPVARVYASSSDDLARRAREGAFLPELAERLSRFTVVLPPLRQRIGDLSELVGVLVKEIGASLGREDCRVQPGALARLKARPWPGNVRELATVLEKLIAFSPQGEISGERVRALLREMPEGVRSLRRRREARQREELVQLLEECGGNLAEVARRLELSRGAVIYRARKYGLLENPTRG
ncbi:MAG: sigma 54-interacting transcriptional regulator, partial [Proteobacteria bacterium]|nr:sigma 54-interacting transcriptional regulator [Pseudomonadota bacterium]